MEKTKSAFSFLEGRKCAHIWTSCEKINRRISVKDVPSWRKCTDSPLGVLICRNCTVPAWLKTEIKERKQVKWRRLNCQTNCFSVIEGSINICNKSF